MTHRETLDFYDENVKAYQSFVSKVEGARRDAGVEVRNTPIGRWVGMLPKSAAVMDLGCGYGRLALALESEGFDVTAVDGSKSMVDAANEILNKPAVLMTFDEVSFPDGHFDGVCACSSLLHHPREDMPDMLNRLHDMMKLGAVLYMSFKYDDVEFVHKDGRLFVNYKEADVESLLAKVEGWQLIEMTVTDDPRKDRSRPAWMNVILKKIEK